MDQEQITKAQFKANALEYFRKAEAGNTLVITDQGQPCLELRRYRSDRRGPLEKLRSSVVAYQSPTEPVAESDWEAVF